MSEQAPQREQSARPCSPTYELDEVTGEATGIVHIYCSVDCQSADLPNLLGPVYSEPDGWTPIEHAQCETCDKVLA